MYHLYHGTCTILQCIRYICSRSYLKLVETCDEYIIMRCIKRFEISLVLYTNIVIVLIKFEMSLKMYREVARYSLQT